LELVDAWWALNDRAKVLELVKPFSDIEQPESPLPWLCLLDVYRALGDGEKYEAIAHCIKQVFNVRLETQPHTENMAAAKTLGDFPHVVARILSLWETEEVVPYLKSLLWDDRNGSREGFDLLVYRDLLRLLALAKDPARLQDGAAAVTAKAVEILSIAPGAQQGSHYAPPVAAPKPAAAPAPIQPRIRERPKYITPSYEKAIARPATTSGASAETTGHGDPAPGVAPSAEPDLALPATGATAHENVSPMAIKLYLAVAYQEIGDRENARHLLEEVIERGCEQHASQARRLREKFAALQ